MSPTILLMILSGLGTGTMITMFSYHWLLAWTGLEINTLAIIPMMAKKHHPRATEAATKYFLTQAAASAMILFSSSINAWYSGQWDITNITNEPASILLTIALAMKLGLAPLHFWLPEVLQGTTLTTAMIITTWQKLAPMTLLILTQHKLNSTLLMTLGILSILVGGWGGLNQTQLRKIMAFSSIAHLGWMVTVLTLMPTLTIINLIIYIAMTLTTFLLLIMMNSKTIQNMTTAWMTSPTLSTITMMTLLSLSGLPPLTGFLPKWLILQELVVQHMTPLATIMSISTLLSLFFYLRLSYTTTLTIQPNMTSPSQKWRFKPNNQTALMVSLSILSLLLLPITPTT
uniref:NADH-ubiquinone oxidoreductase chain 2 n=1 Tax=Zonosaurus sp. TMT-2004a TaxID=302467 RepID=Q5EX03_9SAUR|nr:NADH dehydrogenase subunit 2 [Zonosaurus sp. TMT-2004a]